jgi:hypothetical protein
MTCPLTVARFDLTIYQGATFEHVFTLPGDAPLSALSFRGQIRDVHDDPVIRAEFTCTALPDRMLMVSLTPTQTAILTERRGVYDVQAFTANDEFVYPIFKGRVRVEPSVTKPETAP